MVVPPSPLDPPSLLVHLLTAPNLSSIRFQSSTCAYNSSLAMGCVKTDWVTCVPENSSFNPAMAVHERIYHFLGALVLPCNLCSSFLSVYIHDTDYSKQRNAHAEQMPNLSASLLQQLTAILHDFNPYVESFVALRDWATTIYAPSPFYMVIHSDRHPTTRQVRR